MNRQLLRSLVLVMTFIGAGCSSKDSRRPKIEALNILLLDSSTIINTKDLKEREPFALVYFSPDCEDCQRETEGIIKYMDSLKKYKFYFITSDPFDRLKVFNKFYSIYKYPNIILGKDIETKFPMLYQARGTPFTVIFDRNSRLRTVFSGEADIHTLIGALERIR